ncbi:MAG: HAMP domain-containing sensor histidine kinase [Sphaerochaeta sp.]|uniref:sensor histidine kinase n=1 Tax=Sphaerochaeta sp. TaxID=1972642 RepID=UPI002FC7E78F
MQSRLTLARLNMLLVFSCLFVFMLTLSLFLYFGLDVIQVSWQQKQQTALNAYVQDTLLSLSNPTAEQVSQAFSSLPYAPTYLFITDAQDHVLYSYRKAEGGMGRARMMQLGLAEGQNWQEVRASDGNLLYRYSTHLPSFSEDQANALLLEAARQVLFIALLVSLVISLILAFLFLFPLKKQSRLLASALERMADGKRDVQLTKSRVVEFSQIAQASDILQRTLKQEERLRTQWAQDIAHDLRTPVSVLKGQLEAISDGVFKADAKRLELLLKETGRLEQLISSLSLLTRLESPDLTVKQEVLQMKPLLASLKRRFELQAKERDMQLDVADDQASLRADAQLLERALDNLVNNAIRYGNAHSTIRIRLDSDSQGQATALSVENEGTIDSSFIPRLFDRLSRAETSRSSEGSGLGLAIVKAIASAHHWTVEVSSEQYTRFTLHFTESSPAVETV